eukprot:TRINITY_DN37041_c0_g1_i1.p1 TRINITY_DN37041_c0_g1~~TRINITY_DN37041_c0_g1_i1.p1  ORF type:complete len:570 (-),score=168.08 TRINITY_DN37041_c0_g1_i1:137-1846(-)
MAPAAPADIAELRATLAPTGVLRAGVNLSNFLLVTGRTSSGDPEGVSPSLAAAVAERLGVDVKLVPYKNPAELGDAVDADAWDVGLIGAEPQREAKIAFSAPYCEIPATYLVREDSPLKTVADVDRKGVRIASVGGSAFGLWLEKNVREATVEQAATMDSAFELFASGRCEALAGLTQRLLADRGSLRGSVLLPGRFMAVQQAVGVPRTRGARAAAFVADVVEDLKSSGAVASLIDRHGVTGKLTVPAAASSFTPPERRAPGKKQRIAILGCGAMGSVYAGLFASSGQEVWVVDVWREHIETMKSKGLRVEGASGDRTVQLNATLDASEIGPCDLVIIATKAAGVAAAAKEATKLLKEDGVVLTIQNGLGAGDRIAQHMDTANVMLGVANNFGAAMKGPGHVEHKSMNLIAIGEMNGGATERLDRIVSMWTNAGFKAEACPDINKMIWEKVICNCFVGSTCTLTEMTVGEVVDNPAAFAVALACAREAFEVAKKKGIALSFDDVEQHVRKFTSTVRGARPSMAQDHMAKRRGEVDAINGAIPVEAAKVGLTAPVNQTVADLVRARESRF